MRVTLQRLFDGVLTRVWTHVIVRGAKDTHKSEARLLHERVLSACVANGVALVPILYWGGGQSK